MSTKKREHWKQHACCIDMNDAHQYERNTSAGVYSSKMEGESAIVLLTAHEGPFIVDFKMTPDKAEQIAKLLTEAAAAARAADVPALAEAA